METAFQQKKGSKVRSPSIRNSAFSPQGLQKSKTVAENLKKSSYHGRDFYNLSRLIPVVIKEDKELVFEENIRLKSQINETLEENMLLKTKIKKLQNGKKRKEKIDPGASLVTALKETISELNRKISDQEQEIHRLRRTVRLCRLEEKEVEIKELQEECGRLIHHLKEIMKQKDIPNCYLESENKVYAKDKIISRLNKEIKSLQENFCQVKEESQICKEKLHAYERRSRKTSPVATEILSLKEELDLQKDRQVKIKVEFSEKENKYLNDLRLLKDSLETEMKKSKVLENDLEEKNNIVILLEKQINLVRSESIRPEATLQKSLGNSKEKFKNPPRILFKIREAARQKKMLASVFLSLLDKNNNGKIDVDELRKGLIMNEKTVKKKYADELIRLMNLPSNAIPLRLLEQFIDKYEYTSEYTSSSEEEDVPEDPNPKPDKLILSGTSPGPRPNQPTSPRNYSSPLKIKEEDIALVRPEEVSDILERIRLQMIEKMVLKNRCINLLFGNYLDPEVLVNFSEVSEHLVSAGINLGSQEDLLKFSKFLVEPEGFEKLKESQHKSMKNKLIEFSKKINKHLQNWEIFDKYARHLNVYQNMIEYKERILEDASENEQVLSVDKFDQIVKKYFEIGKYDLMYLYLNSFNRCGIIFNVSVTAVYEELEKVQRKILELCNKHKDILRRISEGIEKVSSSYEKIFYHDAEPLVNIEAFLTAGRTIDIEMDEEFVADMKFGKYYCHLGLLKALLANLE